MVTRMPTAPNIGVRRWKVWGAKRQSSPCAVSLRNDGLHGPWKLLSIAETARAESGVLKRYIQVLGDTSCKSGDKRCPLFPICRLTAPREYMDQRQCCMLNVRWCDLEITFSVEIVRPFLVMIKFLGFEHSRTPTT